VRIATKNRASSGRAPQPLSSDSFFSKHEDLCSLLADLFFAMPVDKGPNTLAEIGKIRRTTIPRLGTVVEQLKEAGLNRILEAAKRENSPEAFKEVLEHLLRLMGLKAPTGVFAPTRIPGRLGRPISSENERIYLKWIESGKTSLFKNDLAMAVYGKEFNKANGIHRRKMRDKCRRAVERHNEREIAELKQETAKLQERTDELESERTKRKEKTRS
jgi:hypothetical protein